MQEFFSYQDGIKGYKSQCGKAHKCVISRDVQFNESTMINKSDQITFETDINVNKTKDAKVINQSAKIEVQLSSICEDKGYILNT